MSKKYDEIKNLFDDVEQSSSENPVEDGTQQNELSPSSGCNNDDGLEFLEKILGVMRQIESLQERCADIQKEQKAIQKRLDGYKDMKVGLSYGQSRSDQTARINLPTSKSECGRGR